MIVVIDASVIVDALIPADGLWKRIITYELHAPTSIDAEVLNGFRRNWLMHFVDEVEVEAILPIFQTLPIRRHAVTPLLERMWELRHNVATYDAAYVALAESLNVPLLTRDGRLSRASGHAARVEYID